MDINVWLAAKYDLRLEKQKTPIEIPNTNRDTLAHLFHVWDFTTGVEVGVERGLYTEVLSRENPGVRLFGVDAWCPYRGYRDHVDGGKLQRFYEEAQQRLAPYPRTSLIRGFSLDVVKQFEDDSLDFVYIDAAHDLQSCINDIAEWGKKIRPGGVIAGHDYVKYYLPNQIHVVQAVHAWTDAWEIAPWFILGSQAKVEGQLRDKARSWFWVKPERSFPNGKRPIKQ